MLKKLWPCSCLFFLQDDSSGAEDQSSLTPVSRPRSGTWSLANSRRAKKERAEKEEEGETRKDKWSAIFLLCSIKIRIFYNLLFRPTKLTFLEARENSAILLVLLRKKVNKFFRSYVLCLEVWKKVVPTFFQSWSYNFFFWSLTTYFWSCTTFFFKLH